MYGQDDIIGSGDILSIEEFRADLEERITFGKFFNKQAHETPEVFVKRILDNKATMHHGAFQLQEFSNTIISFATYEFEGIAVIIGLLLEPVQTKEGKYRLIKTMELSSGCGNDPEINSVFLHDADSNSIGRELLIHVSDYCDRHGVFNYVYIYNRQVENNKLELTGYLSERCDYSEVKINGHWDFDMGDEDVEDRRYIECIYSDFKTIRKSIDKDNNR
ncbi:MAG: hypothetical protein ACQETL_15495 [Bacteroidota bacterium]